MIYERLENMDTVKKVKVIHCLKCNYPIPYGDEKCPGCGATIGYPEVIAQENAKKHTGKLTTPDFIHIQYLLNKGQGKEAVDIVKGILMVDTKKAKEICNEYAAKWKCEIPFPKKSFWSRLKGNKNE